MAVCFEAREIAVEAHRSEADICTRLEARSAVDSFQSFVLVDHGQESSGRRVQAPSQSMGEQVQAQHRERAMQDNIDK